MFTEIENLAIDALRKEVENNLLPFDKQEAQKKSDGFWCADWWTAEVCRCLVEGKDFLAAPLPEKALNNSLWKRQDILTAVEYKIKMFKVLKDRIDFSDELFVCEVGRGVDILLASFLKNWKKITCYDINPYVLEKVDTYFTYKLCLPVESFKMNSGDFDFNKIKTKIILLANQCRLGEVCLEAIKNNQNILAIIDGNLLEGG